MSLLGKSCRLIIVDRLDGQFYLDAGRDGRIPLLGGDTPPGTKVGSTLDVFIFRDSENALVATLKKPLATVGQIAYLPVDSVQPVGAFLKWGLPKDLFLPFGEQSREVKPGDQVFVYVYLDNQERITASMKLEKFLKKTFDAYQVGQKVDLLIYSKTDLGFKAVIDGTHTGVLYQNEIFQPLTIGQKVEGFIKHLRTDGKIDLCLQPSGYRGIDDFSKKILDALESNNGFLPVTDKSSAEQIEALFGLSKKKYKMTVGTLYKKQLIIIEDKGIRLKRV
ncbi:MAG: GntR family transcriptional regulator [Proteobacteria bacterium]|nr:GntR family transcriptional regulator [Pseudomonadota bacterium]